MARSDPGTRILTGFPLRHTLSGIA